MLGGPYKANLGQARRLQRVQQLPEPVPWRLVQRPQLGVCRHCRQNSIP